MTKRLDYNKFITAESKTKPFIERYNNCIIDCIIDKSTCNNALLVFDDIDTCWYILQNEKNGMSTIRKRDTKFKYSWAMDCKVTDIKINSLSNIIKTSIQLISKLKFLTVNQNF